MKKYTNYKSSGIEWIGDIPEHWGKYKLRYGLDLLTDFESNGSFSSVKENVKVEDEGPVWYVRMTDLENQNIRNEKCKYCDFETYNFLNKTKVFGGELLITKRGEIGKVYLFPNNSGLSTLGPNSYLIRLKKEKITSNYLYYFYISNSGQITLKLLDNSTTIGSLYKDDVKGSEIIVPPLPEQHQIVEFLDEKTEIIDKLISTKERKIELLKEQRTSLINQVITKGLDPNVKMKDSGVEWIGKIPEHWNTIKLKFIGKINSGDGLSSELIEDEGIYPVYGGNGIMGYYSEFNTSHPVLSIGRVGEKCGCVHLVMNKCWINDNSLILDITNDEWNIRYLFYTTTIRDLNVIRNQNTQPLITGTLVKNEVVPNPNIQEQRKIVDFLDFRTKEIDDLVSLEQKKIEVLKEYRQSLISEVITGKIDVRTNLN